MSVNRLIRAVAVAFGLFVAASIPAAGTAVRALPGGESQSSCASGLISYWTFDNASDPMHDTVGPNSGTLVGTPQSTAGIVGSGLSLSGDGTDYGEVPTSPSLEVSGNEITVEAWIRPAVTIDETYGPNTILVRKGGYWDGYDLEIVEAGRGHAIHFAAATTDGWKYFIGQSRTWQAGHWYHVVGTYDGTRFRAYVNGNEEPSSYVDETSAALAIGTTPLRFGQNNDWEGSAPFPGTIDEVAIYGRALSASEIQHHYDAGVAGIGYCAPLFTFSAFDASADLSFVSTGDDSIQIAAAAKLSADSDRINVANETFVLGIGDKLVLDLAPDSFKRSGARFTYVGTTSDGTRWNVVLESAPASRTLLMTAQAVGRLTGSWPFQLKMRVGNDEGTADSTDLKARFRR